MRYTSQGELFRLWSSGYNALEPCDRRWAYWVVDDRLLFFRGKKLGASPVCVGLPAGETPRRFFYLLAHWRLRTADRERLEDLGGLPAMAHELALKLMAEGLGSLASDDWVVDDQDALAYIQRWVMHLGQAADRGQPFRDGFLGAHDQALVLARKYRGRVLETVVGRFQGDELLVPGHVGRSPLVNWVKDALLVSASRAKGAGVFKSSWNPTRMNAPPNVRQGHETVYRVVSTPSKMLGFLI